MRNEILRKRLLIAKSDLYSIYTSDSKKIKPLISNAKPLLLRTILIYLHKITIGQVRMRKRDFEAFVAQKRLAKLRKNVELKASLATILKDKKKSVEFLESISSSLPILFRPLFCKEA